MTSERGDQQKDGDDAKADQDVLDHLEVHRFDVVDQDAAADHPAPWLVDADIGDLLHPFGRLRRVEEILDVIAAGLGRGDEILNVKPARRILLVDQRLADALGLGRMHDHVAVHVEHEDVFLAFFIAQGGDDLLGFDLRLLGGHLSRGGALVEIGGDGDRCFDHVPDVGFLLLVEIVAALTDDEIAERGERA